MISLLMTMSWSFLDDSLQSFAAELEGSELPESDSSPDSDGDSFMLNFGAFRIQIGLFSFSKGSILSKLDSWRVVSSSEMTNCTPFHPVKQEVCFLEFVLQISENPFGFL